MEAVRYNMSFSYGSLFQQQSLIISKMYLELGDWEKTRRAVIEGNVLQNRTLSSLKKISGNVCLRLMILEQKSILVHIWLVNIP